MRIDSPPAAQPEVSYAVGGEPTNPQAVVEALARVLISARRRRQESALEDGELAGKVVA